MFLREKYFIFRKFNFKAKKNKRVILFWLSSDCLNFKVVIVLSVIHFIVVLSYQVFNKNLKYFWKLCFDSFFFVVKTIRLLIWLNCKSVNLVRCLIIRFPLCDRKSVNSKNAFGSVTSFFLWFISGQHLK